MIIPQVVIKKRKDGKEVASFRDTDIWVTTKAATRIRTSAGPVNWVKANDIRDLALFGIELQKQQALAGLGSDGSPMPSLSNKTSAVRALRDGKMQFVRQRKGYAEWKAAHGLQPRRDLWGPGIGGHMLESIRINYLDDKRATIAITTTKMRGKARGNENKAPWWGWSPESVRKLNELAGQMFPQSTADVLYGMGIIGAQALSQAKSLFRRVA